MKLLISLIMASLFVFGCSNKKNEPQPGVSPVPQLVTVNGQLTVFEFSRTGGVFIEYRITQSETSFEITLLNYNATSPNLTKTVLKTECAALEECKSLIKIMSGGYSVQVNDPTCYKCATGLWTKRKAITAGDQKSLPFYVFQSDELSKADSEVLNFIKTLFGLS